MRRMLAELKSDISALKSVTAPATEAAKPAADSGDDEVRRMLDELKSDISFLKSSLVLKKDEKSAEEKGEDVRALMQRLEESVSDLGKKASEAEDASGGSSEVAEDAGGALNTRSEEAESMPADKLAGGAVH